MNKEIKYSGFTAIPSDYECPDGQLAASINIIAEDDHLKPISTPRNIARIPSEASIIFIHKTPSRHNFILSRPLRGGIQIGWLEKDPDSVPDFSQASWNDTVLYNLKDIAALGNTLVLSLSEGLYYILWADGSYKFLGLHPPFFDIHFGCRFKTGFLINQQTSIPAICDMNFGNPANYALKQKDQVSDDDAAVQGAIGDNVVYGAINKGVKESVFEKGLFFQPFFVRYAFRLFDGSHIWHSSPILMNPWVLPPLVAISHMPDAPAGGSSVEFNQSIPVSVDVYAAACLLDFKIDLPQTLLDSLKRWSDIIAAVDVFVSLPIYSYDTTEKLSARNYFTNLAKISIFPQEATEDSAFAGHFGLTTNNSATQANEFGDWFVDRSIASARNRFFKNHAHGFVVPDVKKSYKSDFLDVANFYKIASIDFDDLKDSERFRPLPLDSDDLSNLATRQTLKDDFDSRALISPASLFTFNSRLYAPNIRFTPSSSISFPQLAESQWDGYETPDFNHSNLFPEKVAVTVFSRKNGAILKTATVSDSFPLSKAFPRFLAYPDPNAFRIDIVASSKSYSIPLKPHAFLNVACFFNDSFAFDPTPPESPAQSSGNGPSISAAVSNVLLPNKIYVSPPSNPFAFPAVSILTVSSGEILSLSAAVAALSQGQFGQFPLYVFTSDGVWTIEIAADGSSRSVQPVARDVCINPSAVTQLDSAVIFPSDRGLIVLSGSQASCISDSINSESPFDVSTLPAFDRLHAFLGHSLLLPPAGPGTQQPSVNDTCLPTLPFSKFLKGCDIIYDYPSQRVIIFNKDITYAYVYSLKSRQWGMTFSAIRYALNSYPEALAVDNASNLVEFPVAFPQSSKSLAITRPLKLDSPDLHKTVDTVIQRGYFRKGNVSSLLYGSRDLINWHLVWSSKDHFLRGFRGTPYKYFRIALLCALSADESIHGATIQFTPRLTNQPR